MSEPIENIEQLRPCPFCGGEARASATKRNVTCDNPDCAMNESWYHVSEWRSRPIEDALRAEVARLNADRDSEQRWANEYHQQAERLQAELEAVAAAGQRDAALAISLYQENQKLKAALDGPHLAFVHASEELQQAREATCEWTFSEDWDGRTEWNGACGAAWQFEEGGPAENEMSYCPTCGKRLVIVELPEPPQDANG